MYDVLGFEHLRHSLRPQVPLVSIGLIIQTHHSVNNSGPFTHQNIEGAVAVIDPNAVHIELRCREVLKPLAVIAVGIISIVIPLQATGDPLCRDLVIFKSEDAEELLALCCGHIAVFVPFVVVSDRRRPCVDRAVIQKVVIMDSFMKDL